MHLQRHEGTVKSSAPSLPIGNPVDAMDRCIPPLGGHMAVMRIRDHNNADLALAALTLSVAAVAASSEVVRWARGRRGRHRPGAHATTGTSKQSPQPR